MKNTKRRLQLDTQFHDCMHIYETTIDNVIGCKVKRISQAMIKKFPGVNII